MTRVYFLPRASRRRKFRKIEKFLKRRTEPGGNASATSLRTSRSSLFRSVTGSQRPLGIKLRKLRSSTARLKSSSACEHFPPTTFVKLFCPVDWISSKYGNRLAYTTEMFFFQWSFQLIDELTKLFLSYFQGEPSTVYGTQRSSRTAVNISSDRQEFRAYDQWVFNFLFTNL